MRIRDIWTVVMVALVLAPVGMSGDELPAGIVGVWDTGDGAHVEIYQRDGKYHGKFVRFYDEPPADGVDAKNPNPALRGRPLIGTDFIRNFDFVDNKWKNGRIYNPENGKQYRADLELTDGVLHVRGWVLFRLLGRTVTWIRLDKTTSDRFEDVPLRSISIGRLVQRLATYAGCST